MTAPSKLLDDGGFHHELLTLDIWDTVLRRACHPDAVKLHLARYLLLHYFSVLPEVHRDPWVLLRLRQEAEKQLGEESQTKGLDDEYHHHDVYERWLKLSGLSRRRATDPSFSDLTDTLSRLEMEQEKKVSSVDPDISEFLSGHSARKVAFLSDFYWKGETLQQLLDHHRVGQWFSFGIASCDVGLNKRSGRLFSHVHEHFKTSPERHLHIGDNPHADIASATALGISTHHYLPEPSHQRRMERERLFHDREALIEKVLEEMTFEVPSDARCPEAFRYGQRWSPLLVGFVLDVMERAIADDVERLYFLTREGVFFLKIYEGLAAGNALGFDVKPASLLQVSRLSTFAASLQDFSLQEMMRLWTLYSVQSLGALFRTLGLDPQLFERHVKNHGLSLEDPITYPWQHPGVIAFFNDRNVQDLVAPLLEAQREGLSAYLTMEGIDSETRKIGLVDIGWRGSIQDNLALMLPRCEVVGYYLGLNGFLNEQPLNTSKRAFGPDAREPGSPIDLLHQVAPIEMLTNASSGSVTGYALESGGIEVRIQVDEGETSVHDAFVADFQRGVLVTIPHWAEAIRVHALSASEFRPTALRVWRNIIESPPPFLGEAYFKLNHNEVFGVGGFVDKSKTLKTGAVWAAFIHRPSRLRLVQSINEVGWLEGLLARRDGGRLLRWSLRVFLRLTRFKERQKGS